MSPCLSQSLPGGSVCLVGGSMCRLPAAICCVAACASAAQKPCPLDAPTHTVLLFLQPPCIPYVYSHSLSHSLTLALSHTLSTRVRWCVCATRWSTRSLRQRRRSGGQQQSWRTQTGDATGQGGCVCVWGGAWEECGCGVWVGGGWALGGLVGGGGGVWLGGLLGVCTCTPAGGLLDAEGASCGITLLSDCVACVCVSAVRQLSAAVRPHRTPLR